MPRGSHLVVAAVSMAFVFASTVGESAAAGQLAAGGGPVDNRLQLSRTQSERLVQWASALQACIARNGVRLGAPVARSREIDLLFSGRWTRRRVSALTRCGDSLGGPPRGASLQIRKGMAVLYLPRQCLLDPKVVAEAARRA